MREPLNDLFELIKSLSPAEKAYFKKYSQLHVRKKNNNYLLLFDAIDRQDAYSEEQLMAKFRGENFTKQFSVAKNYLYRQVLYAMDACHDSSHKEVKTLIHQGEFLFEKGLIRQSEKILNKAKQIAEEYELPWALLEINHLWKYRMALLAGNRDEVGRLLKEEAGLITSHQKTMVYRHLYADLINRFSKAALSGGREKDQEIEKIFKNKYISDKNNASSFQQKLILYQMLSRHAVYAGNNEGAYKFLIKKIDLYGASREKIKLNLPDYIGALSNAYLVASILKKYTTLPPLIKKMEHAVMQSKGSGQRLKFLPVLYIQQLDYSIRTGDFKETIPRINLIIQELNKKEFKYDFIEKALLYHNFAVCYFGTGDLKSAIQWLNQIRSRFSLTSRPDMESAFHLLRLVVHYEAKNMEILPSLIQSAYRFFLRKSQLYKAEKIILDFLRTSRDPYDAKAMRQLFSFLKKKLDPLMNDPHERTAFFNFDYLSWVESKIQDRSFAEIVQENFLKVKSA